MRSPDGAYFPKFDHLRGVGAFLVYSWQGVHALGVPFTVVPLFPEASLLIEGHIGVSLFLALSGYLSKRSQPRIFSDAICTGASGANSAQSGSGSKPWVLLHHSPSGLPNFFAHLSLFADVESVARFAAAAVRTGLPPFL